MLLGIMLLTSCGKTDHQDQASVATEQTAGKLQKNLRKPSADRKSQRKQPGQPKRQ